jgi:uncharacterized protein (UPF0371 family)
LSAEWSSELADTAKRIEQLDGANKTYLNYLDFGAKLLELTHQAEIIYKYQNDEVKWEILKAVHLNSFWKDGELTVNYKKIL